MRWALYTPVRWKNMPHYIINTHGVSVIDIMWVGTDKSLTITSGNFNLKKVFIKHEYKLQLTNYQLLPFVSTGLLS